MKKRHSYSEACEALEQKVRTHINALSPSQRLKILSRCTTANTHLYAWLRGNTHAISAEALDELMDKAGIYLTPAPKSNSNLSSIKNGV